MQLELLNGPLVLISYMNVNWSCSDIMHLKLCFCVFYDELKMAVFMIHSAEQFVMAVCVCFLLKGYLFCVGIFVSGLTDGLAVLTRLKYLQSTVTW